MAVEAPDVALGNFIENPLEGVAVKNHLRNLHKLLPPGVVKGQDNRIINLTFKTAFPLQVFKNRLVITFGQESVPFLLSFLVLLVIAFVTILFIASIFLNVLFT